MITKVRNLIVIFLFINSLQHVQSQTLLPNITLKTLEGDFFYTSQLNNLKPTVISLWATWCVPCINELDAINDVFEDWQDEVDFDFYAISVDDSRTLKRVRPMVNGKGWNYNILLDTNGNLKRSLGAAAVPVTLIVKDGKIVYRHSGYTPGAEDDLFEELKKHAK